MYRNKHRQEIKMKIFAISDLHYFKDQRPEDNTRHGQYAVELLKKSIIMANEVVKPDIFLAAGDMIDRPEEPQLLEDLAGLFNDLKMPFLVIPGNHDPAPEIFYRTMPQVPEYLDVKGFRFIPFPYDKETPGWNACREKSEIDKLNRLNKDLPVIMFQHVPVFKPGRVGCFYNYDNVQEIFENCENVVLSISGHWHFGYCPSFSAPFASIAVPSLCEERYAVSTIELAENGEITRFQVDYLNVDGE
jgi:calcineurin-like phosphoesterase family protein